MKITSKKHYNYLYSSLNGLFMVNLPIKAWAGTMLGILCYITGAESKILEMIGMLLIADFLMGFLTALKHRTLSSDFLVAILYRAAMYFVLLMGVNWFVLMCPYCSLVRELVYLFIAAAELISIMENADLLGFKYAKKIIDLINKNVEEKLYKQ